MVRGVTEGRRWRGVCVVLALTCGLGGCATRQPTELTDSFVQAGESDVVIGEPEDVNTDLYDPNATPPKLEDLEVERPAVITPAATRLEDSDPALSTALVVASSRPSPAAHRRVAELYQGHGVTDMAYDHLLAAERLAPDEAATQDSLARLWRSVGMGGLGLGSAYRAAYEAPDSPEAHNTLGTLLQAVGHREAARHAYERGLRLDPLAAYVLNNLCFLAYSQGAYGEAAEHCEAAVRADPSLEQAYNNLALVYFSTGQDELAWKALQNAGSIWTAMYNLGVIHMARGNHEAAAAAFGAVSRAKPNWASRDTVRSKQENSRRPELSGNSRRRDPMVMTAEPVATTPPAAKLHPTAPSTLEESGLSVDLVLQLALKTLFFSGQLTGTELADRLKVNFQVIEPSLEMLVDQRHVAIVDGGVIGRSSFTYRISDAGRERADLFLQNNHYVGAAPVPLSQYRAYMEEVEAVQTQRVSQDSLRAVVSEKLVVSDKVLDQLGPAINARHSLFLYGPPGNGKSVIAAAMGSLLQGGIEIPHALEIEGSIVRLFDPVHHEPIPPAPSETTSLQIGQQHDDRWINCKRPVVMVGGELELENLDLVYNPGLGFYRAPVQTKANGGVLVIDDFGRQRCSPQSLLNRWIVPLETRYDYLTLQTGQKISIPFSTFIVFATNIKPADLVDEAFLRRIHYKVFAQSPTIEEFLQIFDKVCGERGVEFKRDIVEDLLERYYRPRQLPMRGCHPRDLVEHVVSLAEYRETECAITPELLDAACASYFVDERESASGQSIWNVLPPK